MKNKLHTLINGLKNKFRGHKNNRPAASDETPTNNGSTLSQEEANRRIDKAAKVTVERYGHIIERLSKE